MKFPFEFKIDVKSKEDLGILWACFNISNDNVRASLHDTDSEIFRNLKETLGNNNSNKKYAYLAFKSVIWEKLENMIIDIESSTNFF